MVQLLIQLHAAVALGAHRPRVRADAPAALRLYAAAGCRVGKTLAAAATLLYTFHVGIAHPAAASLAKVLLTR